MSARQDAAIVTFLSDAGDGHPSFGYGAAKVVCPECDGWKGIVCPHGCGVHLVSTQAEKDAEAMAQMRAEDAERKERRAVAQARRNEAS